VHLCSQAGIPFVAGPALNIYSPDTLALMAKMGAIRWVPPVEMPRTMLTSMPVPENMQTELFAFGRLPLAFSARCFTARHFNLQKDDCQFRCIDHADGMDLNTREGEAFLVMNGIQTQSASVHTLAHRLGELSDTSVTHLRLSPQSKNMAEVVALFRDALDARISAQDAKAKLATCLIAAGCDGYWLGKPGLSMGAN
jgi:O2-independent ubiquinone biosynthesis protein UbiV